MHIKCEDPEAVIVAGGLNSLEPTCFRNVVQMRG